MWMCDTPDWVFNIMEFFDLGKITEETMQRALIYLLNEKIILCVQASQA